MYLLYLIITILKYVFDAEYLMICLDIAIEQMPSTVIYV
jgi:hypothetical protein